jgi:lipid A 3-O-deacylase
VSPVFKQWFFILLGSIHCGVVFSQLIDNSSSLREIDANKYIRIHYDNDFFTNTDHYYTQGITLEYAHPLFKKFVAYKILPRLKNPVYKTGTNFDVSGYTPTNTDSDSILHDDRPFAGVMSVKLFSISFNQRKTLRLASAIRMGIIGPAAMGEEIQTNIHRWTGNKLPRGWQHQIKNDIILNYQFNLEQKWISMNGFILNGMAELRAGTLHNSITTGINFMAGHFNDPFGQTGKRKTNYYFFAQSQVNLVGYDASMQGGLFNRKSVNNIRGGDIRRITFQGNAGLVVNFKKIFFSYGQSFLTREFYKGRDHRWSGLSAGFVF